MPISATHAAPGFRFRSPARRLVQGDGQTRNWLKNNPSACETYVAYAYFRLTLRMMMLSERLYSSFLRSESRSTTSHIFAM